MEVRKETRLVEGLPDDCKIISMMKCTLGGYSETLYVATDKGVFKYDLSLEQFMPILFEVEVPD